MSDPPANRAPGGRFRKGQSGNPAGRPKVNEEFRDECRKRAAEVLDVLMERIQRQDTETRDVVAAAALIWGRAGYLEVAGELDIEKVRGQLLVDVLAIKDLPDAQKQQVVDLLGGIWRPPAPPPALPPTEPKP